MKRSFPILLLMFAVLAISLSFGGKDGAEKFSKTYQEEALSQGEMRRII